MEQKCYVALRAKKTETAPLGIKAIKLKHRPLLVRLLQKRKINILTMNSLGKSYLSIDSDLALLLVIQLTNKWRTRCLLQNQLLLQREKEDSCCYGCEGATGNSLETIFVKGFQHLRARDEIKNELSNFFASCGKVVRVFVPMQMCYLCSLGIVSFLNNRFAFIDYSNGENEALKLNGSYMGGRKLEVKMATDSDEYYGFVNFAGCDLCRGPGKRKLRARNKKKSESIQIKEDNTWGLIRIISHRAWTIATIVVQTEVTSSSKCSNVGEEEPKENRRRTKTRKKNRTRRGRIEDEDSEKKNQTQRKIARVRREEKRSDLCFLSISQTLHI
ncbi:hypothetical protein YC2023_086937 [Brassica napus]